jgi:hypothetical protein
VIARASQGGLITGDHVAAKLCAFADGFTGGGVDVPKIEKVLIIVAGVIGGREVLGNDG